MIRAVVFDFDGTLVDSVAIKENAFAEVALAVSGGDTAMQAVRSDGLPQDRHSVFRRFAAQLAEENGQSDAEAWGAELAARYSALCEERISACKECPGAGEILARLKAEGYQVYLNSATPAEALQVILARRGLDTAFREVYGIPPSKEENLRRIVASAEANPGEVLVVGDGADDAASAAAVGCHYLSAGCGRNSFEIKNLEEILERLPSFGETANA